MTDIQAKYQKLASEYAKLRAQLPVLKKAVLDEQSQGEILKNSIKDKDQSIRKYEQEIDSLSFRNQQMSARVEVLQRELDDVGSKGKKGRKGSMSPQLPQASPLASGVIDEELQNKIQENERLHMQVYESNQEHQHVVTDLRDRLTILEGEASRHQEVLNATVQRNTQLIDKLQEEKAMLEVKLQKQELDVKEAKERAESAEHTLCCVQEDLTRRLEEATKIIAEKLPFNDTKHRDLNALNIPTHDRKHQLQSKELVGQAASLIHELVQALSNFHTYTEQRTRIYPTDGTTEPFSDVNKKFCQYLLENASYLRPVEQAFKTFQEEMKDDALTTLETATGLQEFAEKFNSYVAFANKLLPYQLLSIEEECSVSSCTSTLEAKNMELHGSLQQFSASLNKVNNYISLLAAQSDPGCDHPRSSHPKLFELLSKAVTDFQENTKEVSKHYNAKVSLEHQLPTATTKLKTTDECIVSSLVSLVTCTSKISAFLGGNLEFFCKTVGYKTRGSSIPSSESNSGPKCHPAVGRFRQNAANYISTISKPCPESVPYKTAVHNKRTLLSSTESRDSLAQQVVNFQEKVARLEQDKEHWMLEAQLQTMKYDKEIQKVVNLEKQMKRLQAASTGSIEENLEIGATDNHKLPGNRPHTAPGGPVIESSLLGQLETCTSSQKEGESREELIRNHFSGRIAELMAQLQLADSKALNFHAECRALHKRLSIAQKQRDKYQEDLSSAMQSTTQLKDELETTTKSYEGQLSMMSDHLAGMNEKLTTQKDEIELLKYQLQQSVKGGKNKKK